MYLDNYASPNQVREFLCLYHLVCMYVSNKHNLRCDIHIIAEMGGGGVTPTPNKNVGSIWENWQIYNIFHSLRKIRLDPPLTSTFSNNLLILCLLLFVVLDRVTEQRKISNKTEVRDRQRTMLSLNED